MVPVTGADSFFRDLAEKISALEDLSLADPLSTRVAVARMKRYLATPEQRINLHDFLGAEAERVHVGVTSDRFLGAGLGIDSAAMVKRLRTYEAEMNILLSLLACGGYWSTQDQFHIFCRAIKRIGDDYADQSGLTVWLKLRRYPGLLAFYALGIAAIAAGNYRFLNTVFSVKIRTDKHRAEEPVTAALTPLEAIDIDHARQMLPGMERHHTPMNDYVFDVLRTPLRDYTPDDVSYG
jgi:hypothetical protein